jgi:hypothetical protein
MEMRIKAFRNQVSGISDMKKLNIKERLKAKMDYYLFPLALLLSPWACL